MDSKKSKLYQCLFCDKNFLRKFNWQRHCNNVHDIVVETKLKDKAVKCIICGKCFSHKKALYFHCRKKHACLLDHLDVPLKRRRSKSMVVTPRKSVSITPEEEAIVREHLPKEYCYKILNYVRIDENKFQFRVKFQINELDEVSSFLESYTVKNWIRYRLSKVNPTDNATVFHKQYCCHHNAQKKKEKNRKNTNCPATASLVVKAVEEQSGPKLYCIFRVTHNHNHKFDESETKYLLPNSKVAERFRALLLTGLPPYKALKAYKEELMLEYGDEFPEIEKNRSICPNPNWVYNFYYKLIKEFECKAEKEEIVETLQEIVPVVESQEILVPIAYTKEDLETDDVENMEIEYLEDEFENENGSEENFMLHGVESNVIAKKERTAHNELMLEEFEKVLFDIINRVSKNIHFFKDAIGSFCENYKKIKTDAELAAALTAFAENLS